MSDNEQTQQKKGGLHWPSLLVGVGVGVAGVWALNKWGSGADPDMIAVEPSPDQIPESSQIPQLPGVSTGILIPDQILAPPRQPNPRRQPNPQRGKMPPAIEAQLQSLCRAGVQVLTNHLRDGVQYVIRESSGNVIPVVQQTQQNWVVDQTVIDAVLHGPRTQTIYPYPE